MASNFALMTSTAGDSMSCGAASWPQPSAVAARWTGVGTTSDGTLNFLGNDLLRIDGDRFVEYWAASSGA